MYNIPPSVVLCVLVRVWFPVHVLTKAYFVGGACTHWCSYSAAVLILTYVYWISGMYLGACGMQMDILGSAVQNKSIL